MSHLVPKSERVVMPGVNSDAAIYQIPNTQGRRRLGKRPDKVYGPLTNVEKEALFKELRRLMTEAHVDPDVTVYDFAMNDAYKKIRRTGIFRKTDLKDEPWTEELYRSVLAMREQGLTFNQIAVKIHRLPVDVQTYVWYYRYRELPGGVKGHIGDAEFQDLLNLVGECLLKKKRVSRNIAPGPLISNEELLKLCSNVNFKFEIDWVYVCDRLNRAPTIVRNTFYRRFGEGFSISKSAVATMVWSDDDVKHLIRTVYDCGARDITEILWSWFFPDGKHSTIDVRTKWMQLRKRVMCGSTMTETEIAEKLAEQMKFDVDVYDEDEWGPAPTAQDLRQLEEDEEQAKQVVQPVVVQPEPIKQEPVDDNDDDKREHRHKHKHRKHHHEDDGEHHHKHKHNDNMVAVVDDEIKIHKHKKRHHHDDDER